jgi:hypothetical protein
MMVPEQNYGNLKVPKAQENFLNHNLRSLYSTAQIVLIEVRGKTGRCRPIPLKKRPVEFYRLTFCAAL